MVKKIFKNTFVTSLIAVLLSVCLILFIFYGHFEEQMFNNLSDEVNLLVNGIKYTGKEYFEDFTPADGVRITWIDKDGTVLYDSEKNEDDMDNHGQRDEIKEAFEKGESKLIRYSDTLSERTMYYARLLDDGSVMRLSYGYDMIGELIVAMLQPVIIVIIVLCGIMYLVAKYTAKVIVAPINNIDLEEGKMESGTGYTEIKPLLSRIRRQNLLIDTNIRKLKREHEMREDFRREFTANVSHELKTPLTSISGISEMMMNGIIRTEDIPEFAKNINKEAGRLINLVNDIILISELEGNESYMQKEKVDVAELSASVIKRLEIPAGKRHIDMQLEVTDKSGNTVKDADAMPEIAVFGVYNMIEQLIFNLSDNAIKYNRENGTVRIIVSDGEESVKIIVEDTGIGIPNADKENVFQRFYRVDKGRSKEVGGTGLGLSIVKHIARYHGGSVRAEDRAGGGTRMVAELPK